MPRAEDGSTASRIVATGAVFGVAFVARITSWPLVLRGDSVQPAGSDAFYHLRRILYSVENFPASLFRDPYLNFPHGGEVIWSPAFDWLLAAIARVFAGTGDALAVERLLVWVPPIVGAATVALLFVVLSRRFSWVVAGVASALLAVLPAHVAYSRIGAIDHHVAVAFCFLWLLVATLRWFERPSQDGLDARSALELGVSMAAAILIWPGMLLHLAILQLAFAGFAIVRAQRTAALSAVLTLAAAHALAAALIAPWSFGRSYEVWGDFSPVVATSFQPIYLLASGATFALLGGVWRFGSFPDSIGKRLGMAVGLGGLSLGLAVLLLPSLWDAVGHATEWLTKSEEFQAAVAESAPLFSRGSGIETARAELLLSRAIYLAPIAIAALALGLRSAAARPVLATILWVSTALLLATLLQRRFMNSYAIVHATVIALAIEGCARSARKRLATSRAKVAANVAIGVVVLVLFLPTLGWYANDLANLGRVRRGEPTRTVGTELIHATLLSVAEWLRENSPPTRGFLDASETPEYGVLSAWGAGHVITYAARRPTIQGNFGDDVGAQNFEASERFFSARDEAEALAVLDELRARYVVVGRTGSGHAQGYGPGSMFTRLYPGVREASSGVRRGGISPVVSLTALRLVHTSRRPPPASKRFPFHAVYERVRGAIVEGVAEPGESVEAQLRLLTAENGGLRFVTEVRADAEGRYRLRLPYANDASASTLRRGASYRITSAGQTGRVIATDADVLAGAILEGPNLRAE